MNYKPENVKALIESYLAEAAERLESANALIKIGNFKDSISRSYYAILDAATACLIKKDILPKSHSGAIKLFSMHYIKTGKVDAKYQMQFARIEKARLEADYTHTRRFTKEEAIEIYHEADQFIQMATKILK